MKRRQGDGANLNESLEARVNVTCAQEESGACMSGPAVLLNCGLFSNKNLQRPDSGSRSTFASSKQSNISLTLLLP